MTKWRRCGISFYKYPVSPLPSGGDIFVDPINETMVSWFGYPDAESSTVAVIQTLILQSIRPEVLAVSLSYLAKEEATNLQTFMLYKNRVIAQEGSQENVAESLAGSLWDLKRDSILFGFTCLLDILFDFGIAQEKARIIPRDELKNALAEYGIVEC